jgi:hypothetical protein
MPIAHVLHGSSQGVTEGSGEGIRFRLGAVSACTTVLPMLAFGALLRELEPEALSVGFSVSRMLVQMVVACGVGVALAQWLAGDAVDALSSESGDAVSGLDAAQRLPALFSAGSFGVWTMPSASQRFTFWRTRESFAACVTARPTIQPCAVGRFPATKRTPTNYGRLPETSPADGNRPRSSPSSTP